jgi:flagellar motor switch/type III secretory pathway protein FliN
MAMGVAEEKTDAVSGSRAADASPAGALLRKAPDWPAGGDPAAAGKLRMSSLEGLPVQLDVRVPLPAFRVADLLSLTPGRVLGSEWPSSSDIPLLCGEVQLVWTEFEVVDQTLAVRVTRLL